MARRLFALLIALPLLAACGGAPAVPAPTSAFDPYPTDEALTHYDEMVQTCTTTAQAVGRESEGAAVLAQMEQTFAAQAKRAARSRAAGPPGGRRACRGGRVATLAPEGAARGGRWIRAERAGLTRRTE